VEVATGNPQIKNCEIGRYKWQPNNTTHLAGEFLVTGELGYLVSITMMGNAKSASTSAIKLNL